MKEMREDKRDIFHVISGGEVCAQSTNFQTCSCDEIFNFLRVERMIYE